MKKEYKRNKNKSPICRECGSELWVNALDKKKIFCWNEKCKLHKIMITL